MNTYKVSFQAAYTDYIDVVEEVQADTEEEAIRNATAHYEDTFNATVECIETGEEEERLYVLHTEIAEQNIALDRSGGDYWNYDGPDEEP